MTNKSSFEKAWYESKKFLSFLFMEIVLGFVLCYLVAEQGSFEMNVYFATVVIALASIMGFIAVAFNLSQAKLDSYIRMSALMNGKKTSEDLEKGED